MIKITGTHIIERRIELIDIFYPKIIKPLCTAVSSFGPVERK